MYYINININIPYVTAYQKFIVSHSFAVCFLARLKTGYRHIRLE